MCTENVCREKENSSFIAGVNPEDDRWSLHVRCMRRTYADVKISKLRQYKEREMHISSSG